MDFTDSPEGQAELERMERDLESASKCECCGVAWRDHLGVQGVCKLLQEAESENQRRADELQRQVKNAARLHEVIADLRRRLTERMGHIPPGPWLYRPMEHDDWGVVRDANGMTVCNTCPPWLAQEFNANCDERERQIGPLQAMAVARLLIDAESNERRRQCTNH